MAWSIGDGKVSKRVSSKLVGNKRDRVRLEGETDLILTLSARTVKCTTYTCLVVNRVVGEARWDKQQGYVRTGDVDVKEWISGILDMYETDDKTLTVIQVVEGLDVKDLDVKVLGETRIERVRKDNNQACYYLNMNIV